MTSKFDYLIAGLGNPGSKYENTRHNIGWMVADAYAQRHKLNWNLNTPIYYGAELQFAGKSAFLCMPTTYMNNSGEAVRKICEKYQINKKNVILIVDEYNFDVGKIQVKRTGGSGGHNGTASVIQELGSNDFIKMRCGIGKRFPSGGMVDYVLSNFPEEDYEKLAEMKNMACDALDLILKIGDSHAASVINSGKLWLKQSPE